MKSIPKKELELFEALHLDRSHDAKTFNKPAHRGYWRSIIEKYPDPVHFVYELLQNADDANATDVSIYIDKTCLIFKHNGTIRFNITNESEEEGAPIGHINAITGVGYSTKTNEEVGNKIGKFGMGFKSVFKYTNCPEIYDEVFKFKIEDHIVPTLLSEDHPLRRGNETLFRFPFKSGYEEEFYNEIRVKLDKLNNPILFLRNLKSVTWRDLSMDMDGLSYHKILIEQTRVHDIDCELYDVQNSSDKFKIWMFSRTISVEQSKHVITVGFYLTDKNGRLKINTHKKPKVFCFFPTSESFEQCFVMHAPFLLTDSRQNILKYKSVNEQLINELASLAADSLLCLRDIGLNKGSLLIDENLLDIAKIGEHRTFSRAITNIIYRDKLLLANSRQQYLSASEAYIVDSKKLISLFSRKHLRELTSNDGADFVAYNLYSKSDDYQYFLQEDIEIENTSIETLAEYITADFMAKQPIEWVFNFYSYLLNEARSAWNKTNSTYRFRPIIKTTKGEFVSPYIGDAHNVFLSAVKIDENRHFVARELLDNKTARKFIEELGIKEVAQEDIIDSILHKYENDENVESHLDDIRYLMATYRKIDDDNRKSVLSKIKEKLKVRVYGDRFSPISATYNDTHMFTYFKHQKFPYLDNEYYKPLYDEFGKEKVLSVLGEWGLNTTPRVCYKHTTVYDLPKAIRYSLTNHRTTEGYGITRNYMMEGIEYALANNLTQQLSIHIWQWTCEEYKKNKDIARLKCRIRYYSYSTIEVQSEWFYLISTKKWIYGADGTLHCPSELTRKEFVQVGYQYDNDLFDALKVRENKKEDHLSAEEKELIEKGRMWDAYTESDRAELDRIKAKREAREKAARLTARSEDICREPMRNSSLGDMFSGNVQLNPSISHQHCTDECHTEDNSFEERKRKIEERQEELAQEEVAIEELREAAANAVKYSKEWFDALLQLEYKGSKDDFDITSRKAISITFGKVVRDKESDRIFILKHPTKQIPLGLEEIGGLTVKFRFSAMDEQEFSFEVANVRDYTLRLKALSSDLPILDAIDWNRCTAAEVNINNPVELIGKLCRAFDELNMPTGFNYKNNIREDLCFVFGPPGTGKTTYLAKQILDLMDKNPKSKILVLTPTNNACDVLAKKVCELAGCQCAWLHRFVACGDMSINNLVCDRDTSAYKNNCCIISTIARLPYDGFNNPNKRLNDIDWDYVIVDEASMIPVAQIVYAIYKCSSAKKVIIAGDPFQISPIIREQGWVDENIYTMVNLNSFCSPQTEPHQFNIVNLETQHRSVPAIGSLFSEYSYNGQLKHSRKPETTCKLKLDKLPIKTINFIPFRVERADSVFAVKKLYSSNVHIYSVLFTVEFAKYIAKQWQKNHIEEELRMGIICPYVAQAQLIDAMMQQQKDVPENIQISCGTIHSFQGDECNVIITVFNPPKGLKGAADRVFLNRQNILNVAISRARDYLFILLPHTSTDGYNNLVEIQRIGHIAATRCKNDVAVFNADEVEQVMYGSRSYIESNTFVTSHQMANVYTDAIKLYEVRIDETAVDIQINTD